MRGWFVQCELQAHTQLREVCRHLAELEVERISLWRRACHREVAVVLDGALLGEHGRREGEAVRRADEEGGWVELERVGMVLGIGEVHVQ